MSTRQPISAVLLPPVQATAQPRFLFRAKPSRGLHSAIFQMKRRKFNSMDTIITSCDAIEAARLESLHRFYSAFSTGNVAELDRALTPVWDEEPRNQGQDPGREPMKQFIAGVRQALPDLTIEIKDVVFGEQKAAVRAEMRGTHSTDFFGVPATGRSYAIRLHEFHAFDGAQIVYTWHMEDWFAFLNQIGAWPVAPAGGEQ